LADADAVHTCWFLHLQRHCRTWPCRYRLLPRRSGYTLYACCFRYPPHPNTCTGIFLALYMVYASCRLLRAFSNTWMLLPLVDQARDALLYAFLFAVQMAVLGGAGGVPGGWSLFTHR